MINLPPQNYNFHQKVAIHLQLVIIPPEMNFDNPQNMLIYTLFFLSTVASCIHAIFVVKSTNVPKRDQ